MRSDRHTYDRRRVGGLSLLAVLLAAALMLFAGCASAERELDQAVDEVQRQANSLIAEETGASEAPEAPKGEAGVHTVTRVVDGDTMEVSPDAAAGNEDVRLLAVDTPETYGGAEPLGPEAKAFTTEQLEGAKVKLEYDEDRVDPYDRALAFVAVVGEEQTIQAKLLSRGLAQTLFYEPNTDHEALFTRIQDQARERDAGTWGLPLQRQCKLARDNGLGEAFPTC